jgi:hypothetical protein
MSSIEEEDESIASDEAKLPIETMPCSLPLSVQMPTATSIPDWDSELSESEQEFDDNHDNTTDHGEEQAAHRALKSFVQSGLRPVSQLFVVRSMIVNEHCTCLPVDII